MWSEVDEKVGAVLEEGLSEYVRSMLDRGTSIQRFVNSRQSALKILSLKMDAGPMFSHRPEAGLHSEADRLGKKRRPMMQSTMEVELLSEEEEEEDDDEEDEEDRHAEPRSSATFTSVEDLVLSAAAELSSISEPLFRSLPESTSADDNDFVPYAMTVPLVRVEDDDFTLTEHPSVLPSPISAEDHSLVPSSVPEPLSIAVPLYRVSPSPTPTNDDLVPSTTPDPLYITIPLYRVTPSPTPADNGDFIPSSTPEPLSITVPLSKSPLSST